jgi:hypothetical protein
MVGRVLAANLNFLFEKNRRKFDLFKSWYSRWWYVITVILCRVNFKVDCQQRQWSFVM